VRTKELFKHLRMGCGEPLRTVINDKEMTKKILSQHNGKEAKKKINKEH